MTKEKSEEIPTGLYWKGKKTEVDRVVLPFQTIETINESRATRESEKIKGPDMFKDQNKSGWYNRLIWGDNKLVMASLLEEFAGKIDLIYIDPPFATGADFRYKIEIGDVEWTKEPSAIEEKAYRDTWGQGLESYLQMIYERLVLMRDLLSPTGTIYIHLDWKMSSYVRIIADEIFGQDSYVREIIWRMGWVSGYKTMAKNWIRNHDNILFYAKDRDKFTFNKKWIPYPPNYERWGGRPKGKGLAIEDVWGVFPGEGVNSLSVISFAKENLGYPTQKSEGLLKRIIEASSNERDIIADFFCGSGTMGVVAEKLGRQWIMADIGRYAIHTTRKRLLGIEGCKPFVVQNLGKYERQYWQGVTFKKRKNEQLPIYEYIQFILKLYNAEPLAGMLHIHGRKGKHFVHVGAVDAPVTLSEIKEANDEVKKSGQKALDILGWEWEMGLHDVVEKAAKESGIRLQLLFIPRDVMDPRAVEKGDVTFYELAYLEVEAKRTKSGDFKVKLKDFAIPNLDLIPQEVRDKIRKWSDYIDYWSVDWDWNEDTFHNMWQSYRTRKERKLELTSDSHNYETKGKHKIMVKVIDIFGNDTTHIIEVKS